ncbi:hypothetical protein DFA_07751 [Cavenderia fasciculata]|uniref:Uncharacterized protein n=1 Tax=Cavenderia fasciculata TaxID=261658 RepID=F4Q351_CACFS|nr:uncharacterized protein DFA_07751 [Cavenderia fasciculata]EGG16773.1 hypothetical protein DFA_07751 [Cavenderia fasciculata]|eukprot:XP_004355247.1 hypothetical protein DFA_07751 [Cavenderia fasciculata]
MRKNPIIHHTQQSTINKKSLTQLSYPSKQFGGSRHVSYIADGVSDMQAGMDVANKHNSGGGGGGKGGKGGGGGGGGGGKGGGKGNNIDIDIDIDIGGK